MGERRPLIEGLKSSPQIDPQLEKAFVYGTDKVAATSAAPTAVTTVTRVPISTRIRSDFVAAL